MYIVSDDGRSFYDSKIEGARKDSLFAIETKVKT